MKIVHISDTHLRSLSRHKEFVRVFEEMDVKIRKEKPDHIIHTGDVFHTKCSGITGEYINILTMWFRSLAEIAPFHITLGNHDGLIVNLTREDAVSPIVNAMQDQRIHVYKNSGVYRFAPGYNFCVYSIFDEEGWERVKPIEGDVNIAVFHGPVQGSTTEAGWELQSDMSVSAFEDYTATFLGDIHKFQHLGYRDYELEIDEEDLAKYPNAVIL